MRRISSGRNCTVCGQGCDFDVVCVHVGVDPDGAWAYDWQVNVAPLQTGPRAMYFQEGVDFCGPWCSLIWYEGRLGHEIPEWLADLKGRKVAR